MSNIIMTLMERGVHTDVYNVASVLSISVNEIFEAITREIPSFKRENINSLNLDVQSFELDITKLRNKLGGYRMTSFDIALKETIVWEKNNMLNMIIPR